MLPAGRLTDWLPAAAGSSLAPALLGSCFQPLEGYGAAKDGPGMPLRTETEREGPSKEIKQCNGSDTFFISVMFLHTLRTRLALF